MSTVVIPENHVGPPSMAHGGYVAGLLARELGGTVQVTLRQPTPTGTELTLEVDDARAALLRGDDVLADAVPATLDLAVPRPPTLDGAQAAEADSPSRWDERGVHPICLGCGLARPDHEGLEIAVGPTTVDGAEQVAATWRPGPLRDRGDGTVDPLWVLAALDCPGAMAFIARQTRVGLLGRIVFEQRAPVTVEEDHVVTGWQIEIDGRKHFAGTALATAEGTILAAARATWFSFG